MELKRASELTGCVVFVWIRTSTHPVRGYEKRLGQIKGVTSKRIWVMYVDRHGRMLERWVLPENVDEIRVKETEQHEQHDEEVPDL